MQSLEGLEKASRELNCLRTEFGEFEKRVKGLWESVHRIVEIPHAYGANHLLFKRTGSPQGSDEVSSRLAIATNDSSRERTRYVREREAAKYIGVSVSALRRWRTDWSRNGPPFTRLVRLVMYPIAKLEAHMRA